MFSKVTENLKIIEPNPIAAVSLIILAQRLIVNLI
jgi:hypothetical protein